MRTADHLFLGKYLANSFFSDKPTACQKAFILGNVYPDINFFTYFRGAINSKELKGHNYENAKECIKHIEEKLEGREYFGVSDYFMLGILVHYTADSFTFPHNKCFGGTLKMHVEYEDKLHFKFLEKLNDMKENDIQIYPQGESFYDKIISLHSNYLLNIGDMENDLTYIFKAARIAVYKISRAYETKNFKEDWRYVS